MLLMEKEHTHWGKDNKLKRMEKLKTIGNKMTKFLSLFITFSAVTLALINKDPIYGKLYVGLAIFSGIYFLHQQKYKGRYQ